MSFLRFPGIFGCKCRNSTGLKFGLSAFIWAYDVQADTHRVQAQVTGFSLFVGGFILTLELELAY